MTEKNNIVLSLGIFIVIIAAIGVILYNKPDNSLQYDGVRIYDAIRKYNELSRKGFSVSADIRGRDSEGLVNLNGEVVEGNSGFFVVRDGERYRLVEGPLGSQDIRADIITFSVEEPISIEFSYSNIDSFEEFLSLLKESERFRGAISFTTKEPLNSIIFQEMKNTGFVIYGQNGDNFVSFENGMYVEIKESVDSESLAENLEEVNSELNITDFLSGRVFVFTGAGNDEKAEEVIQERNYESYRKYELK